MVYNPNKLAIPREQLIFVKKETVPGTLVFPAAADAIRIAGNGSIGQNPAFTDSPEIVNSRDVLERVANITPAGNWSFPIIIRPSGTAGSAPMGDVLLECLLGKKTVVGATSVTYSQQTEKPSFSLWFKMSHAVFFAAGCTVSQARISLGNTGYPILTLSGQFMSMGWMGTNQLNGTKAQGQTAVVVDNAKHYRIGGYIWNVTDNDNRTNQGYRITDINYTTNTLTLAHAIAPVGGWADDAEIAPYLPTPSVPTSHPSQARHTEVEIDDVAIDLQSLELTIDDPVTYLEDEITTTGFPEDYAEGVRNINGSLNLYFRAKELRRFYDGYEADVNNKVEIFCGVKSAGSFVAGKKCTILMGQCKLEVPAMNIQDPVVSISIPYKALGSSGEDSLSIAFT